MTRGQVWSSKVDSLNSVDSIDSIESLDPLDSLGALGPTHSLLFYHGLSLSLSLLKLFITKFLIIPLIPENLDLKDLYLLGKYKTMSLMKMCMYVSYHTLGFCLACGWRETRGVHGASCACRLGCSFSFSMTLSAATMRRSAL